MSRFVVGKFLQMAGMVVVGYGLMVALLGKMSTHMELIYLAAGAGIFWVGTLVEGRRE